MSAPTKRYMVKIHHKVVTYKCNVVKTSPPSPLPAGCLAAHILALQCLALEPPTSWWLPLLYPASLTTRDVTMTPSLRISKVSK